MVLSAKRARDDVARAISTGADDYVTKPIDRDVLIAKMQSVLNKADQAAPPASKPIQFAKIELSEEAQVTIKGTVEVITENDLLFFTHARLQKGETVEFSTPLLSRLGVANMLARVISRTPREREGKPGFLYHLEVVGLPESDRQRLRKHTLAAGRPRPRTPTSIT